MAGSTYSTNLKIELMTTGENSGTWGDVTNTNLGTALEQAVVGYGNPDYVSDANLTISITNSNAAQAARALVLNVTSVFGSLTQTRELVVPTIQKQYIVQNNTTGGQSITVKTSAGTGITVPNGRKAHLYVDGTNVIQMFDYVDINGGSIDGTPVGASSASTGAFTTLNASGATTLDGNVTLGNASGDTVTVTGTIASNLLFTDNTYDIGASGATRPRNLYLAGAATIGGNLSVGGTLTLTGGLTLNGNVTVGDSAADTLTINSTVTSNLLFTDNTYDIGASGATRPRNLFLAGNATIGGNQTLTGSLTVDSTTDTSSATTGSIQTDGGVGIAKSLYVGGNTTLGDTSADTVTVNGTITSNLIFTDNTYDIGADGATRPRRIFTTGNVQINKATDPLFLAIGNSSTTTAGFVSSIDNASNYWFAGTRGDGTGGVSGTERWNLLYGSTNLMYMSKTGNAGFSVVPQAWATGITAVQVNSVTALRGDTNSAYLSANFYQDSGGAKYINGSAYAGQYHIDQTGGSNGVHKWGIAPNTGTGGGALSLAVPMYLSTTGQLVVQSTALTSVTQIALANLTGSTKNNQIIFQDSTNTRWRVGTDVATNNNTNNFQIYNDATASSALTVDASSRFLFGAGFETDVTNGVIQARSAATGTTFQSNPAIFGALNTVAGREVPGLYMGDGTSTTLISQIGNVAGIFKDNNLAMTILKSGSYANIGLYGAGGSPLAPLQINGAGVYAADANSSYIGSGAGNATLSNYGITGNYALRHWMDSATNKYYWQSSGGTGTAGNAVSYSTWMTLDSNGLGIRQAPQSGYALAVTGNQIINDGGWSLYTTGSDMLFQRSNNDAYPPAFLFRKSRGTYTSPTAVTSGDGLGITYYQGYDGSGFQFTGSLQFAVSGAVSTGSIPTQFTLGCGSSGNTTRLAVNTSGLVNIGGGTSYGVGQILLVVGEGATSNADQGTTLKVGTDNASFGGTASIQGIFCARSASSDYRFLQINSGTTSGGSFGDAEFIFYGNGNANADGTWNNNGADYAEFFESATGQEFPVGTTVVLDGNKVRPATEADSADQIMGVVRPKADGTASMVIGNTAWNKWNKKYLQDDFGVFEQEPFAIVEWVETIKSADGNSQEEKLHSYEEDRIPAGVVVPSSAVRKTTDSKGKALTRRKLNPAWSPDEEYIPRIDRPEWMIIGLIGQIPALANQPVNPRWTKMREISASVFEYFVR